MAATVNDWRSRLCAVVSTDKTTNGGVPGTIDLISAKMAEVFPVWEWADMVVGGTLYRKLCHVLENEDSIRASSCKHCLVGQCDGDDEIHFCSPYAWDDVEDDIDESAVSEDDWYGVGVLATSLTSGVSTSIDVTVKSSVRPGFALHSGSLSVFVIDTLTDTYEIVTVSGVTVVGTTVTLSISGGGTIANSYTAASTVSVSAMLPVNSQNKAAGIVRSDYENPVVTSASGTCDGYWVDVYNDTCQDDTITLTFKAGGTGFTAVSDYYGTLADGDVGSDWEPLDALGRSIIFIDILAWGGTFSEGDTVVIVTYRAGFEIWYRQTVPAGASAQANDSVEFVTSFISP